MTAAEQKILKLAEDLAFCGVPLRQDPAYNREVEAAFIEAVRMNPLLVATMLWERRPPVPQKRDRGLSDAEVARLAKMTPDELVAELQRVANEIVVATQGQSPPDKMAISRDQLGRLIGRPLTESDWAHFCGAMATRKGDGAVVMSMWIAEHASRPVADAAPSDPLEAIGDVNLTDPEEAFRLFAQLLVDLMDYTEQTPLEEAVCDAHKAMTETAARLGYTGLP